MWNNRKNYICTHTHTSIPGSWHRAPNALGISWVMRVFRFDEVTPRGTREKHRVSITCEVGV